jgi:aryl-alcohol dehydrogenase-like predicted oxidoreductase
MSQGFVGSTIVGATSLAQLKENLQACSRVLDTHILAEIDDIHLQFRILRRNLNAVTQ